jgi:hypothetical protein
MNRLQANSRCECQATLTATLDEKRHVLHGTAIRRGAREKAPAHSINAHLEHFDIAWLCPYCGRNTLRTFYAGALVTMGPSSTLGAPNPAPAEPAL